MGTLQRRNQAFITALTVLSRSSYPSPSLTIASHLHIFILPCTRSSSLGCLILNIWRPPCSKHEDDHDNATKMNQPMSPSRQRFPPKLCPKQSTPPPPTHPNPFHHRRRFKTGSSQNGEGAS
jgi:hypothetical protein